MFNTYIFVYLLKKSIYKWIQAVQTHAVQWTTAKILCGEKKNKSFNLSTSTIFLLFHVTLKKLALISR